MLKLSPVITWETDKAPIEPVTLEEKVGNRMVVVSFCSWLRLARQQLIGLQEEMKRNREDAEM